MQSPKEKGCHLVESLLEQVQQHYQLPKIVNHGFFTSGGYENINSWFITESGEKFAVRLALYDPPKGAEDWISSELQVLELLKEECNGKLIPVVDYISTKDGNKYFEFQHPEQETDPSEEQPDSSEEETDSLEEEPEYRFVTVSRFIDGEHLTEWENKRELWQTERIGCLLGQLHLKLQNWKPQNDVRLPVTAKRALKLFHEGIASYKQEVSLELGDKLDTLFATLEKLFPEHLDADVPQDDLPQGFVHSDLHDLNVLFDTTKKEVACVLDWDDACYMPLLYDIGLSVLEWCCIKWRLHEDFLQSFLLNYQLSRKLTPKEQHLMWNYVVLVLSFQLGFLIQPENRDHEALLCIEQYLHTFEKDIQHRIVYQE